MDDYPSAGYYPSETVLWTKSQDDRMDTMNLCLFAPEFLPVWGGTGSYVVELVKFLPKEVNVHVITLRRTIPGMTESSSTTISPKHIFNRDMRIHYISDANETFFYNLGFQIACYRKIPKLHKEYRFDMFHSQFGHMSDIFLQLSKKIDIPSISTVHGTIALLAEHSVGTSFSEIEWSEKQVKLFYPLLRTSELLYARRISEFIAVSEFAKERVVKDLRVEPNRVKVILNGVDTELFHPASENETEGKNAKPTVVFIGRMVAKKGVHVLIRAMPDILKRKPDTNFLFVGGGLTSFYRRMVERLGIPNESFSFIGHIGYFQRPKILQQATVFVNPSFFELCSLSILEAMSCGTSVVASNVEGNTELIKSGKDGLLIPVSDHQRLAEAVISLLEDENLRSKLGKEARHTVEKSFTAKRTAEETYRLYRQLQD